MFQSTSFSAFARDIFNSLYKYKYFNILKDGMTIEVVVHRKRDSNLLHTTGPTPDKKCIQPVDVSPSHEILRQICFFVKPLKSLNRGW